jgi:hypothetical protein
MLSAVPTRAHRVSTGGISRMSVKNFNFNPGQRSAEDQIGDALRLLEAVF